MNSIHPEDSLDNLSNLQLNRHRQLFAQVKQLFTRGLQKLQMAETREIAIAEIQKLIEQYREPQFLRGYVAILKTLRPNSNSTTKEHQILVVSILAQTYKEQLLDPIDKPPSLVKTAFRLVEVIHAYFNDHSPTVQQACARVLLDLYTHCLSSQTTQTVFSIVYAPLISILKSGVDKSSQATASACLSELINYNRRTGGDQLLTKLAPEMLSAVFKVNSEYHELFQAILGLLQFQGLNLFNGKLVTFLAKMKSVIDGTREMKSINTTNLNAYMCKVNVCKMIEKVGRLLSMPEKEKLFELRIPEALQQAARHRVIQVQMAAARALKAWRGQALEESPKNKRLSSLQEKRNNKKLQRSKSKDERGKAESELTFMKEDLDKLVKGGWGANNRAKNYIKRGTGVGGGHVSSAELSPQSKSPGKSHKEHLEELRQFIKKGSQDNKNIDRFAGLGQQPQQESKASPTKNHSPPPARAKSPARRQTRKKQSSPEAEGGDFGFSEDAGEQMVFEPRPQKPQKQRSEPREAKKGGGQDRIKQVASPQKNRFDDIGMSESQARQLMSMEKALLEQGNQMSINFGQVSEDGRQVDQPKAIDPEKISRDPPAQPVLDYLPLQENGNMYTPQQESKLPTFNAEVSSTFKAISEEELGQLVQEYNLSQVSENLNDVLTESDIKNFQSSRLQEETEMGGQKVQLKSVFSKFLKKEEEPSIVMEFQKQKEVPVRSAPKQNLEQPAYSLNFTESQESKVKSPGRREEIQFTLNPKERFSSIQEPQPVQNSKQIQQQIAMSEYEESYPARDQPLPVILPKIAPYTQIPLRHSLVPSILEERQPPSESGAERPTYSKPAFIHELQPQNKYTKEDPPEAKVDYQNLIKHPPKLSNEASRIKASRVSEKSNPYKSKVVEKQPQEQNISVEWLKIIDRIHSNEHNEAYEMALDLDDPIYLLRLMLLSKVPLKKLSPDVFRRVWAKFMEIYSQKFIDVLTVGILGEGNELGLLSRCLSVEEMQDALVGLYELSGSSKGKLSFKAASLYNQIDKGLHPS